MVICTYFAHIALDSTSIESHLLVSISCFRNGIKQTEYEAQFRIHRSIHDLNMLKTVYRLPQYSSKDLNECEWTSLTLCNNIDTNCHRQSASPRACSNLPLCFEKI